MWMIAGAATVSLIINVIGCIIVAKYISDNVREDNKSDNNHDIDSIKKTIEDLEESVYCDSDKEHELSAMVEEAIGDKVESFEKNLAGFREDLDKIKDSVWWVENTNINETILFLKGVDKLKSDLDNQTKLLESRNNDLNNRENDLYVRERNTNMIPRERVY